MTRLLFALSLLCCTLPTLAEFPTLHDTSEYPRTSSSEPSQERGTQFVILVPGNAVALRYYKVAGQTGIATVRLWRVETRSLLATALFSNTTRSGWQTLLLESPVFMGAGNYVVSYSISDTSEIGYDEGAPRTDINRGTLRIQARPSTLSVGVVGAPGTFPNSAAPAAQSWFYTDVLFVPGYAGVYQ